LLKRIDFRHFANFWVKSSEEPFVFNELGDQNRMFLECHGVAVTGKRGHPWKSACNSRIISGMVTQQPAGRLALRALKPRGR
jgi:hypothetical protein